MFIFVSKFEGIVVTKDRQLQIKKHPNYNFMAKESLKNVSLVDQFCLNYDYIFFHIIAGKNLQKSSEKCKII